MYSSDMRWDGWMTISFLIMRWAFLSIFALSMTFRGRSLSVGCLEPDCACGFVDFFEIARFFTRLARDFFFSAFFSSHNLCNDETFDAGASGISTSVKLTIDSVSECDSDLTKHFPRALVGSNFTQTDFNFRFLGIVYFFEASFVDCAMFASFDNRSPIFRAGFRILSSNFAFFVASMDLE